MTSNSASHSPHPAHESERTTLARQQTARLRYFAAIQFPILLAIIIYTNTGDRSHLLLPILLPVVAGGGAALVYMNVSYQKKVNDLRDHDSTR